MQRPTLMNHYIEQIYTNCLAQASYYLESEGEVAIIDPIREPDYYLRKAAERGATIKYVLETHFHADFVSGHQELASATGATIVYGPEAVSQYPILNLADDESITLGKLTIKALHTPGHTPESTCFLVSEQAGKYVALFSGDTLFVGDVGRPDLLDGVIVSKEDQLKRLYTSLEKIKALPDDLVVYPAHGPGSMCGKTIGTEKQTTIGQEKANNYALQPMDFETFCKTILEDQLPAPRYFVQNALINRKGYEPLDQVVERGTQALSADSVKQAIASGAVLLDCRTAEAFSAGFIKGAINVGLSGQFAIWVGTLWDVTQPLVVVAAEGQAKEAITRLARVGFDSVLGVVGMPQSEWSQHFELDHIPNISPEAFITQAQGHPHQVLDVRRVAEYNKGHLPDAIISPLRDLRQGLLSLDKTQPWQVHCAGGYRSMIAASMLKANGFEDVSNIIGGYGAIVAATKSAAESVENPA